MRKPLVCATSVLVLACGSSAGAPADVACFTPEVTDTQPSDAEQNVTLNARMVARLSAAGCGLGGVTMTLETGGTPVDLTTVETRFDATGGWAFARPVVELSPDTDYVLSATTESTPTVVGFRTGSARTPAATAGAGIEVLDERCQESRGLFASSRACTYNLRLTPPAGTTGDKGVFFVNNDSPGTSGATVASYLRGSDTPLEVSIVLSNTDEENAACFSLEYENAAGEAHQRSAQACGPEPQSGPLPGCSSTAVGGEPMAALLLIAWVRRRR